MYSPYNPYAYGMPQARYYAEQRVPAPTGNENNGATDELNMRGMVGHVAKNVTNEVGSAAKNATKQAASAFVEEGIRRGLSGIFGGAAGAEDEQEDETSREDDNDESTTHEEMQRKFPGDTAGYNFAVTVGNALLREKGQPFFIHPSKDSRLYEFLADATQRYMDDHNGRLPHYNKIQKLGPNITQYFEGISSRSILRPPFY